jgi:cytochrome c-type biogenesis protein CcmE
MEPESTSNPARDIVTVALLLVGASIVATTCRDHGHRYMMVDQLRASDMSAWEGKELKVHGYIEPGTIVEKLVDDELHRTFILEKSGKRIRVFSTGPKPETVKDDTEIVAVGQLVRAATFRDLARELSVRLEPDMELVLDASELMAKCSGKYEGAGITTAGRLDTPATGSGG